MNFINTTAASLFPSVYGEDGNPAPLPETLMLETAQTADETVPQANPEYVFRRDALRQILSYLYCPHGDGLYITGPTGSGKTSLVSEVAARLNWGLRSITCNARFEYRSLIGGFRLQSDLPGEAPVTRFQKGPLALAMERGEILLLNEIDLADAGEVSALNDVLDGRPLVIAENGGEIVRPHPRFRFIATGNSAGFGDETGRYAGVRPLNMAFMDRFRILDVPYADPKVEQALLQRIVPKLGADVAGCMVQLAGHIRRTFETGDCSVTLSTRGLCRWARLAHDYRRAPFPLRIALDEILLRRASPSDRDSILDQCRVIFGNLWQGAESGDRKSEKPGDKAEKSAEP